MGRFADAWKALTASRRVSGGSGSWLAGTGRPFIPPASQFDYLREAGDLQRNSVFTVCHAWLARQFMQPDWAVGYETTRDEWTAQKHHPLRKLLENVQKKPDQRRKTTSSSVYGGAIGDYLAYGNAYLAILMNGGGEVVGLDWIPAKQVIVETDNYGIVRYRRFVASGIQEYYEPEDVVHVKFLPDPDEPLIGIGPVQNQVRNVAALNAGERTNGALLRNGTIGKLISPKVSVESIMQGNNPDEAAMKQLSMSMQKRLGGDNVGRIMETTLPVELLDIGASPEELAINEMLDRPEAMICAACGLNSMAVNLPSSRDSRTYSNYEESVRSALQEGLVPLRDAFADAFTSQLAIRWDDSGNLVVWTEYQNMPSMQQNAETRANVANVMYTSGLYTRNDSLKAGGWQTIEGPDGDKYFGEPTEAQLEQEEAMAEEQAIASEEEAAKQEENRLTEHSLELDKMKFAAKLKPAMNGVKK